MQKVKIDTIIFDFDSTLLRGELLEILAEFSLKETPQKVQLLEEIKTITDLGMNGEISFSESLSRRLKILGLKERTLQEAMPHIENLLNKEYFKLLPLLKTKKIYIISGGYSNVLFSFCNKLSVPRENIFAIKLNFKNGIFSHIDQDEPLLMSNGKAIVAKNIADKGKTLMVGDGMTDYQVKAEGGADYFAVYTGVVERKAVCQQADFVLSDIQNLAHLIV